MMVPGRAPITSGTLRRGIIRAAVGHASQHARHALRKHRHEDEIHENQRQPEMHPAPEFIHLPPGHLWEPIINAGEQRKNRPRRDDIMEVGDDVISVVKMDVAGS